jgi:hypothetical protein
MFPAFIRGQVIPLTRSYQLLRMRLRTGCTKKEAPKISPVKGPALDFTEIIRALNP